MVIQLLSAGHSYFRSLPDKYFACVTIVKGYIRVLSDSISLSDCNVAETLLLLNIFKFMIQMHLKLSLIHIYGELYNCDRI